MTIIDSPVDAVETTLPMEYMVFAHKSSVADHQIISTARMEIHHYYYYYFRTYILYVRMYVMEVIL